jgi:hypothetical protein
MRFLLVCAAFSFACSSNASAIEELPPTVTAFAYSARHSALELSDEAIAALRPGEDVDDFPVEVEEDAAPLPGDLKIPRVLSRNDLCRAAASVADANNLPVSFFANLIQQESGWKPHAVSPAGAQGIAQFMPRTAQAYGLHNPFDPVHALVASGKFLGELLQQFGNLGLAAAAYNAGPRRVQNWIARRGKLPEETRNYVRSITGRPAEHWAGARLALAEVRLPPHARCTDARTMEAQAMERAKPVETEMLPSKKTIMIARSSQKTFVLASADADVKLPASKSGAANATSVKLPPVGAAALKAGARAALKTVTIKGGKIVSISAGPAARRFVAMKTPTIMVPEKGASHGSKRRGSVLAARKPLDPKRVSADAQAANKRVAEGMRGKGGAGKRVKVAAARAGKI